MTEEQSLTPAEELELSEAPDVYNYDRVTRVLVGAEKADLDALTYQMHQRIEWLVPAQATLIAPPPFNPETHAAVFDPQAQSWSVVIKSAIQEDQPTDHLPSLDEQREAVVVGIDRDVDDIIFRTIGNRATEYLMAEQEANAFKLAGYPEGNVPASVEDDMLAFSRSAQEAADAILAQAAAWRTAQQAMRRQRLVSKAAARQAASTEDLGIVLVQWQQFTHAVEQQLGI